MEFLHAKMQERKRAKRVSEIYRKRDGPTLNTASHATFLL